LFFRVTIPFATTAPEGSVKRSVILFSIGDWALIVDAERIKRTAPVSTARALENCMETPILNGIV
jgi:hypothetical protein